MKTTFTTQHNAASTQNGSHSTHNVYSPLRRLTLLVTLLMTFALGARAAQYVFYNANYGYYLALNGTNLVRTNTFNPSTCVWTGPDGNSGTFSIKSGNSTYYLRYSDGLTTTTDNNNATAWTIGNNKVYYSYNRNNYYIRYSNSSQAFQARNSDSQNEILYKCVLESVAASSGEKSYTVSLTSVTANPAVLDYNKSTTVTANGGSVTITTTTTPAHTKYTLTPNGGSGTTTVYYSQDGGTVSTTSPVSQTTSTTAVTGYEWVVSPSNYTTLGNATTTTNTNTVTYSTASGTNTTVTLSATAYYTEGGQTYKSTAVNTTLTLNEKKDDPTGITANDLALAVDEQKSISYTLFPSNAHDNIAYSGNYNGIISIDANGVVKGLKAGITEVTLTAKKLDNSDGPLTKVQVTVTPKAPTIEFSLGANTATISTTETGATIYYTTDGTTPTPTTSSSVYTAPVSVTAGATVKAIVVVTASNGTKLISPVAEALVTAESGIINGTVYLYDLEDHNWTYYSGVDASVYGGNYNTKYAGKLYSPNPRNVKITYNANGGAVSIDESETSFVYFKTLEQGATAGQYPYTVISSPFSKRPTGKGFGGWKIISGGEYINGYNNGSTLPLDQEITFVNLPYPSTNCISAEIELEATWVNLNNIVRRTNTGDYTYSATGGTYETNILVLKSNHTGTITVNSPCTIMMVEPDGTDNFRDDYTFSGYIVPMANGNTKIEFARWRPGNDGINPRGRNFTIGRGMVMDGTRRALYGTNTSSSAVNQILKVESGNFSTFTHYGKNPSSITKQWIYFGNDYDRANGKNDKLTFSELFMVGDGRSLGLSSTEEMCRVFSISGSFMTGISISTGAADYSYYLGIKSDHNNGHRYFEVQGGEWYANIAGGMGEDQDKASRAFTFRMKGGIIRGSIYGAGAFAPAGGERRYIITGGNIGGWVAAGCNGIGGNTTQTNNGATNGDSYVYVGGNAKIGYQNRTINDVEGGNVFGAGRGAPVTNYNVGTINNSNVVVADKAEVEKNVYGGGNYGFSLGEANIYITGGSVDGRVFGGANMTKGYSPTIIMTGGHVKDGVYGGCNTEGTINNNVTMQINGGQVGTPSKSANIHGGGYGQATRVSGNVEVTLGTENQATGGVTVYGDVYGGSALGYVNGTTATNTYHTHVTMNKGTIYGSLYGGALGSNTVAANVYGPVEVKVHGGSVKATSAAGSGGVYGANNINGAPQRSVTVDIYGTDPAPAENQYALHAVYGGGNQAPYTYGNGYPKVTVHNCGNSIEYVYGGGNAAAVAATDVTIWGGNVIGNVFGGGNGTVSPANVNGDATTKIHGGTILNVYGGSNAAGTINGDIKLTINSMKEEGSSDKQPCTMDIGSVYGGGNLADMNGNISVSLGCINHIKELYGGARNANIGTDTQNSNINLTITSGHFDRVFGGNNLGGAIKGSITVNIEETGCNPITIGELYGGGNLAAYSVYGYDAEGNYKESGTKLYNDPVVNILSFSSIGRVFGGGLGNKAVMVGSPTVNINEDVGTNANNTEWPYLGQTISYTDESSVTLPTRNSGAIGAIGTVFGGGNAAPVIGNTQVNIGTTTGKADIRGNVYGGGNQANVTGKTNVVIGE